jgi:hypothetical protein
VIVIDVLKFMFSLWAVCVLLAILGQLIALIIGLVQSTGITKGPCARCGRQASLAEVSFRQNIGVVVLRLTKTEAGFYCKSCIHQCFWPMWLVTGFTGWFGVVSLLTTPFILSMNVFNFMRAAAIPNDAVGAVVAAASGNQEPDLDPDERTAFLGRAQDLYRIGTPEPEVVKWLQREANLPRQSAVTLARQAKANSGG